MNTTILTIVEMAGTIAFAISGIRLAATKRFDLFGAYVVGLITAIGGGTIRDVILDYTPFWMEDPIYLILTAVSLSIVIIFGHHLLYFKNTFFIFDTIGLALFTIVGLDKALMADFPYWVAIIMGMVTGCFGGVMRDVIVGDVPLLFRRDIYALATLFGGLFFAILSVVGVGKTTCSLFAIAAIILMRFVAVKFHLHLPILVDTGSDEESTNISIHSQTDRSSKEKRE